MALRSAKDRVLQTLGYEAGGLLLAIPLYVLATGSAAGESARILLALSAAVLVWAPVHNVIFDALEWRLTGRAASDRPHRLRLLHAMSLETSILVVTLPLLMLLGGFSFWQALLADIGLTALYVGYAYVFHYVFDRLRPMQTAGQSAFPTKPEGS